MGWPKQQLIEAAYEELALAGYVFDLNAEVRESALRVLDAMMAEWLELGIDLGYPLPASPDDSNIDDDSNLPLSATTAVWTNLAVRIAGHRGKTLTAETKGMASSGYSRLLGTAVAPTTQSSGMPLVGAGNKPWRSF